MAPPPELIDDVAAEIFLRLPPDEPEHLIRASLVCKPWLRLLTDPDFTRRYRAFHRTPPLLGFLQRRQVLEGFPEPRLTSTTAVPITPNPSSRDFEALDCRHGRVLLRAEAANVDWCFMVWDPLTGDKKRLPEVGIDWLIYSAAVFCAVDGCDHLDCHGGPFRVVFMATDDCEELVKATVYSSETDAWSTPVTLDSGCQVYAQHCKDALSRRRFYYIPYVQPRRGALVGDEIYFTVRWNNAIVKYDWTKNCISMIDPPSHNACFVSLMEMGDTTLGFASIEGSSLHLRSRKVRSEGSSEWMQCRVIKLDERIPGVNPSDSEGAYVVGSAEGVHVIFVATSVGLFTFELKSGRVRKVDDAQAYFCVLPYMSFYTPGCGTLSSVARPRTG